MSRVGTTRFILDRYSFSTLEASPKVCVWRGEIFSSFGVFFLQEKGLQQGTDDFPHLY